MYNKINIVESKTPPTNKNDWWYDLKTGLIKKYKYGSWSPVVGGPKEDDPYIINTAYYTTTDGSTINLSGSLMSDSEKVLYQHGTSSTFKDNTKLLKIVLTEGTISIPKSMFNGCSSLQDVVLPSSLQSIKDDAFAKCASLYEIHLPKNLNYLGKNVFPLSASMSLSKVTGKYTIKDIFVVYNNCLYYSAISGLYAKLEEWDTDLSLRIPEVEHLGEKSLAFLKPCFTDIYDDELEDYKEGYIGFDIHIPDTVVTIDPTCFLLSANAIHEFVSKYSILEGKALAIGDTFYCFAGCGEDSPTDVYIPDNITVLNQRAFQQCLEVKNVYLPKSISEIGVYCFYGCEKLEAVYCPAIVPPALLKNKEVFPTTTTIYVPQESVDAYKKATNWVNIASQIKGYNF